MIIQRDIKPFVQYCAEKFPVLTLTGPRQSGKTTLAKSLFGEKNYITLEDPDTRTVALRDPRGFLNSLSSSNVILDEVQNCPELFSYIQTLVDQRKQNCQFILTGSQNFSMLEKISQSLAGRAAIINLLPFSYNEISKYHLKFNDVNKLIYNGSYPTIYDKNLNASVWCQSYIMTYLERDVRKLINVSDLTKFQTFLKLCAGRIGQLVNFSSLATECGTSYNTIKSWLSILEASYIVYLHRPHFKNFNKRLVKQHKLYFYDTSIACSLLGIKSPDQIFGHYMKGALFENFVVIELIKNKFNLGQINNLYFWRDSHGHELDIVIDEGAELIPIEVKSSQTFTEDLLKGLKYWNDLAKTKQSYLVYQGSKSFVFGDFNILRWDSMKSLCS